MSDHCPLLIVGNSTGPRYTGLRFESCWPKLQGYLDVVRESWEKQLQVQNPFLILHTKLQRAGKSLKKWARSKIGRNKLLLCAVKQLVAILDVVQDYRPLSQMELQLKKDLKTRILGMTAIEKLRAKQQSRLTHLKAAETQAKLFHIHINGRRRKNYIQQLQLEGRILHMHEEKEDYHIFQYFSSLFGPPNQRLHTFDWSTLQLPVLQQQQQSSLEEEFSEEEIWQVIDQMASEKAPGPDGYIGFFFKTAWSVIRQDFMAALNHFYQQRGKHFDQLNKAHMVLIPKISGAKSLSQYRPISLTHSVAKIISKLLANRLAPHMNVLVSRAQSAFI